MEFAGEIVSSKQFVAAAKDQLKLQTTDYDIMLLRLAQEGIRHLNCLSLMKKNVRCFEICDNRIILPKKLQRLIAIRLKNGTECHSAIYMDLPFLKKCECGTLSNIADSSAIVQIEDGALVFYNLPTGVTEATLAYMSFHDDATGLLVGQSDYERAVVAYICWKYTLSNFQKYPQSIQETYRREWVEQKRWVRGQDWAKSFQNTKAQIREFANALIVDKNIWL